MDQTLSHFRNETDHPCIVMYTPSSDGGHARYSWELLTALAQHHSGYRFELMTSQDLEPQFDSDLYRVHRLLPVLEHRNSFRTRAGWVTNRLTHYSRREWIFLNWLKSRPDVV